MINIFIFLIKNIDDIIFELKISNYIIREDVLIKFSQHNKKIPSQKSWE